MSYQCFKKGYVSETSAIHVQAGHGEKLKLNMSEFVLLQSHLATCKSDMNSIIVLMSLQLPCPQLLAYTVNWSLRILWTNSLFTTPDLNSQPLLCLPKWENNLSFSLYSCDRIVIVCYVTLHCMQYWCCVCMFSIAHTISQKYENSMSLLNSCWTWADLLFCFSLCLRIIEFVNKFWSVCFPNHIP